MLTIERKLLIKQQILMYKTTVYTRYTSKTANIGKRWHYSAVHWHL